mmetsp:Transcript_4052/g.4148  ORF Transcript_4052/g.4148 Transcript_4052/m.4148 type:complete len:397 (+) Transcript_4052:130-1320(+)
MFVSVYVVVILLIFDYSFRIIAFTAKPPFQRICGNRPDASQTRQSIIMAAAAVQPFNPFTARHKNTRVRWFEADLEAFYAFVEEQPLLTAEQELQFGKAIKMGAQVEVVREMLQTRAGFDASRVTNQDIAQAVGCSSLSVEKMSVYSEVCRSRLVNSNLKLVLAVVSRYRTSQIPNAELIAEGTRGLSRAVLRYDYSKGFRFATYATWYVHQAIAEYVRWRKHPAKMPSRYLLLFRRVKQYSAEFKAERNRLPTIDEITMALKAPRFDIVKVLSMQQYPTLLTSPIRTRHSYKQEGKDRTIEDVLPSGYKAPSSLSGGKDLRRDMEEMMQNNLNDVQRDVLRLRLGLDDGRVKPVKEVGKKFKISWKQVRNLEKEAIDKLLSSDEISEFVHSYHST